MPPVKLSAVIDALEMQFDETHAYVDKQAGKVVVLSDEETDAVEDEGDLDDYPEWQRDMIVKAREVVDDEVGSGQRFVPLPDRFEINEWDMMRRFADSQENESHAEKLLGAIHGKGAFRYFKDIVRELGLTDAWYKFRDSQYRQVALDWCENNGIEVDANG